MSTTEITQRPLFPSASIPNADTTAQFDGETFEPKLDQVRLNGQLLRVYECMKDGQWRTLGHIVEACGHRDSEAAVSARLRDLRKPKFGSHTVERRRITAGLFDYRLIVRNE